MTLNMQKVIVELRKAATNRYWRVLIDFSIITFLAVIIFRTWLFTNEWPAGGDVSGWISRAYIFGKDFRWLYMWRPYSFGFVEGINSMDFFLMLANFLFNNPATTIKAFTFFSFLTAGFSMYGLTYHYTHRHTAALSGSLVYCLNQWLFSQLTEAHIDIVFSYALAPLIFLILVRALERRKLKDILGLALALSLVVTSFHPESIVIYGLFFLMFTVFYFLSSARAKNLRIQTKNVLKAVLPAVAVCFLISAFLFIPFLLNIRAPYYSPTYVYPIEDAVANSYGNMTDAFTLRAVESWGYKSLINVYSDLSLPDFPIYALLSVIFILAFCTVFVRRDRYTIFFAFSIVISTFMAKGPNFPFGYLFTWMWFNVPHFAVFRAVSRSNMVTAFSLAFLVAVLVSILLGYTEKRRHAKTDVDLKAKANFAENSEPREVHISIDVLNKAAKGAHKILYYLSVILLVFIFLSGFLSCFFFFSQGLQVYTPPESYIKPYDWLANQTGDFKVITVTNSASQWMNLQFQESDFASNGMLTDIGWTHDTGYDSSFITDKPTLQGADLSPVRVLMNYFRYRLVRRYLTDGFLRMLGPFNYKYLVLPEYLVNDTRDFFLNQQGYHIVYNQSSLILQNDYYTPRFFVPSQHVSVMGGLASYASFNQIDSFNLNQTALFFANPTNEAFLQSTLNSSEALVFSDSDITDAAVLSTQNNATFIKAVDYGASILNFTNYWISSTSWSEVGSFVWGGTTLTTNGKNNITIPFKVDSDGNYDIWLRIGFANNRGKLTILIDGANAGEIQPLATSWAKLMWAKIGSLNLKSGNHEITLKNDGTGYNDIDMIAAVKSETFQSAMKDVLETLRSFPGRIIYILGGVNTFTLDLPPNWYVRLIPYEGYILSADNAGTNLAPLGNASASSEGTWDTFTLGANQANDGTTNTRWASNPYEPTPQWLQIEWPTPQEISGVHILFERAYAQNFSVQTWDGAEWIDQINITGNTMLDRYHSFPTTTTTKLRIYVTSVIEQYHLVSIWELEAYKPQGIHTNIAIPRESDYLFALRLATGPDKGIVDLEVGNFTESVDCLDSNQGFSWKYFGPFHLDATNYTIAVGGTGKIDFDEMMIYSLNQNEHAFSVDDLFKPKPAPIITYDQANPCQYTVHVENSTAPFLLVFSESYEPMWKAYVGNNEISPIPMYSAVNGFYISKTGNFDVTIYFTGQTFANIGLEISAATLVTVVAIIVIPSRKLEELRKRIKHKNIQQSLRQKEDVYH